MIKFIRRVSNFILRKTNCPSSINIEKIIFLDYLQNIQSIAKRFDIKIENLFDIGCNNADDAKKIQNALNIKDANVYCFEANSEIYQLAKSKYPNYNIYNNAVFDVEKELEFNSVKMNEKNIGISSIYQANKDSLKNFEYKKEKVLSIRMDNFMEKNNIANIDLCKIDVEGATFEVVKSFGDRLKDVKIFQIEAEHYQYWNNIHLFDEIYEYLKANGFLLFNFSRYVGQSDSIFINNNLIKE